MKVFHLIQTSSIGGAERVLLNGIPAQRAQGIDAQLILLDNHPIDQNAFANEATKAGLPLHRIQRPTGSFTRTFLALTHMLRREGADVLHVHGYWAATYGLPAAKWVGCHIVLTRHGVLSRNIKEKFVEGMEFALANQMDAVIPVAAHLGESVRTHCALIPNAIPLPEEAQCGQPQESPKRLLFVGRLSQEKAPMLLLHAFTLLRAQHPELTLDIVGDGPMLPALKVHAEQAHLSEAINFHGFCDPQPFYKEADLLVMTSLREGLPLVALEALASRIPVVASDVGALPNLLQGEIPCGFTYPAGDVDACAKAIAQLLERPGLARQLGTQGREWIETHHSLDVWASRHKALYHELTPTHSPSMTHLEQIEPIT